MVFSGDLLKETYSKFKPEYTCWFDKNTCKYLDKYQVLCLQVQVSTKYFLISKCQVQVSTKYSRFCIKYQVQVLYLTPTLSVIEIHYLCDKNYMYVLQGNHNKTSKKFKMLCLYWFKKKYCCPRFEWICWYFQSNPILKINSWFEKLPIWPRRIYCCFVNYAQIP